MAYARVVLTDGTAIEVGITSEHPDALDQMVARVKELWDAGLAPADDEDAE
jgi:hypothetical protein